MSTFTQPYQQSDPEWDAPYRPNGGIQVDGKHICRAHKPVRRCTNGGDPILDITWEVIQGPYVTEKTKQSIWYGKQVGKEQLKSLLYHINPELTTTKKPGNPEDAATLLHLCFEGVEAEIYQKTNEQFTNVYLSAMLNTAPFLNAYNQLHAVGNQPQQPAPPHPGYPPQQQQAPLGVPQQVNTYPQQGQAPAMQTDIPF